MSAQLACEPSPPEARAAASAAAVLSAPSSAPAKKPKPSLDPAWFPKKPPSRAKAEPPGRTASAAELRRFVEANPKHPEIAKLRGLHDAKLLPCGGWQWGARCTPRQPLVARGIQVAAARYLEACLDCKHRLQVQALQTRMRSVAPAVTREAAIEELEESLLRRDPDAALQVLADHDDLGKSFKGYAGRKVRRRFRRDPGVLAPPKIGAEKDRECRMPDDTLIFVSPDYPSVERPLRVVVTSERRFDEARLVLESRADGGEIAGWTELRQGGGPPYFWVGNIALAEPGRYRLALRDQAGDTKTCRRFRVQKKTKELLRPLDELWRARRSWNRRWENLYSVWMQRLFDEPEATHWTGLHTVTQHQGRNFLHNHLGYAEDDVDGVNSLRMTPDCADGPHFFRAYFSWKLGLPFGYHRCKYGTLTGPPRCSQWTTNEGRSDDFDAPFPRLTEPRDPPGVEMTKFLALVKNEVTARSLRTAYSDDASDLYPVPLTRESLRPGTVFSDPYGHTLTLVRWEKQTEELPGSLLAVDAQPDGTIQIKRFWRGNFLFAPPTRVGGHGFKAFRPIILDRSEDEDDPVLRPMLNWEIKVAEGYGNYSQQQTNLDAAGFYAIMDRLINPRALSPMEEYEDLHRALYRQIKNRVREVDLAEDYKKKNPGEVIEMPPGRQIFRTEGPWEAFSTPCRDMRLLVGIDTLNDFPKQVARRSTKPDEVERILLARSESWTKKKTITYTRSDGSQHTLSMFEVLSRVKDFELGWNPNDCPEVRWAAPEGSAERKTCRERAPEEQQKRMIENRQWFERRYSCG